VEADVYGESISVANRAIYAFTVVERQRQATVVGQDSILPGGRHRHRIGETR
jgi:hypothetical protein